MLNVGADIENTSIMLYVFAIYHFICYLISCELSLFSVISVKCTNSKG